MLHRAMIGNECDRRTFNLPGGIGLASSLSERESDLEAPVAPGLRRIGLLTKVVAYNQAVVMVLPSSCLSFSRVEEALASDGPGFFYERAKDLRSFLLLYTLPDGRKVLL